MTTTTFLPKNSAKPTVADEVVNFDVFFPNVRLSDYRAEYKADDMVTDARLKENIETAIIFINHALKDWQNSNPEWTATTTHLYLRAIYHRTKIYILEQAKDIDTTAHGDKQQVSFATKIRQEQAREREIIRLITGRRRTSIHLV